MQFDDENIPNLFKKIKGGIYNLPSHLSPGARDLIPRMLLVDPLKRITIPEIRCARKQDLHALSESIKLIVSLCQVCCIYLMILTWPDVMRLACRQHPWFTLHLPRYLAIMQADPVASATVVDPEMADEVARLGFDRQFVIDSVKSRASNKVG